MIYQKKKYKLFAVAYIKFPSPSGTTLCVTRQAKRNIIKDGLLTKKDHIVIERTNTVYFKMIIVIK